MGKTIGCDDADKNDDDSFEDGEAVFAANWYGADEAVADTLRYQEIYIFLCSLISWA